MLIRAVSIPLAAVFAASFAMAGEKPTPVVVELFTSQGCSSCPPADAFLLTLAEQPVDGVQIIPVSWHVDYWNRLGWTDPFSSETATDRQRIYAKQLNARGLYTPQMMVDGQAEFVGSDRRRGLAAIKDAAKRVKVPLDVSVEHSDGHVSVVVRAEDATDGWRAMLVLTEDNLTTDVKRGENGGRTLQHTGVVRASAKMAATGSGSWKQSLDAPENAGELHAVVFVQDGTGKIIAAASQSIAN